jgi:hypothetical protein
VDLGYLVEAFIQQSPEQPLWLTRTQTWSEIVWRGATVVGIFAGGVFAYYKFLRGRTFARRVEPRITGTVTRREGTIYVQAEASAKNIGLSRVKIDGDHTRILVRTRKPGTGEWVPFDTYRVFEDQTSIEPGVTVGEPILIEMPEDNYVAIRLTLGVARSRKTSWFAIGLVNLTPEGHNIGRRPTLSKELKEVIKTWWSSKANT